MGGDIKGGGLFTYDSNVQFNPSLVYGEGLRVPKIGAMLELDGLAATNNQMKRKGYERGVIIHMRSNATQYINFHMLYGGFKKAVLERFILNFWWKVMIKRAFPSYAFLWTIQVISHRDYDTNAYCYFYFSD